MTRGMRINITQNTNNYFIIIKHLTASLKCILLYLIYIFISTYFLIFFSSSIFIILYITFYTFIIIIYYPFNFIITLFKIHHVFHINNISTKESDSKITSKIISQRQKLRKTISLFISNDN